VAEWLKGSKSGVQDSLCVVFSKTHAVRSAVNEYPTLFRAGEGEGGEEEE